MFYYYYLDIDEYQSKYQCPYCW